MRSPAPPDHEIRWLGLDGARGGWAAAALADDGRGLLGLVASVAAALERWPGVKGVLVDMPVGLPGGRAPRRCDVLARRLLRGGRASSVFTPPCRRALAARDHAEASRLNREVTGRGLSIQAWNLAPRIRELDDLLRRRPELRTVVREAHPEVLFALLAAPDPPPAEGKRSVAGQVSRRAILRRHLDGVDVLLEQVEVPRRRAAPDDWVDALVLAGVLQRNGGRVATLPDPPEHDDVGVPMALAVPRSAAPDVR